MLEPGAMGKIVWPNWQATQKHPILLVRTRVDPISGATEGMFVPFSHSKDLATVSADIDPDRLPAAYGPQTPLGDPDAPDAATNAILREIIEDEYGDDEEIDSCLWIPIHDNDVIINGKRVKLRNLVQIPADQFDRLVEWLLENLG